MREFHVIQFPCFSATTITAAAAVCGVHVFSSTIGASIGDYNLVGSPYGVLSVRKAALFVDLVHTYELGSVSPQCPQHSPSRLPRPWTVPYALASVGQTEIVPGNARRTSYFRRIEVDCLTTTEGPAPLSSVVISHALTLKYLPVFILLKSLIATETAILRKRSSAMARAALLSLPSVPANRDGAYHTV